MTGKLSADELLKVSNHIASCTGLSFTSNRWNTFNKNLSAAGKELGFTNINEFIKLILSDTCSKNFQDTLINHLTVSETYFWREAQVYTALIENILPEIFDSKKNSDKTLRIWSAGCSTGEEPYSIAIALNRSFMELKDWNLSIMATDLNKNSLIKAKSGIYRSWSFRNSPSWLKPNYFHTNENQTFEIIPGMRNMITFSYDNLIESKYFIGQGRTRPFDIIFCRNVLMYFTDEWATRISQNLSRSLSKKGWLIVASCELSSQLFRELTPVNYSGAIVYRNIQNVPGSGSYNIRGKIIVPEIVASASPLNPDKSQDKQTYNQEISQLTAETKTLSDINKPVQDRETINPFTAFIKSVKDPLSSPESSQNSFKQEIAAIRMLADKGQLAEALSECDVVLGTHKLEPGLYLLRASILQEMNLHDDAIKALKRAVYIEPDYIIGHFTLGNLYFMQGDLKSAKLHFKNTLDLLNARGDVEMPEDSEGLTANYLKEFIRTNLSKQNPK
jgi:chemotaxis protein methyltransferase CheR